MGLAEPPKHKGQTCTSKGWTLNNGLYRDKTLYKSRCQKRIVSIKFKLKQSGYADENFLTWELKKVDGKHNVDLLQYRNSERHTTRIPLELNFSGALPVTVLFGNTSEKLQMDEAGVSRCSNCGV